MKVVCTAYLTEGKYNQTTNNSNKQEETTKGVKQNNNKKGGQEVHVQMLCIASLWCSQLQTQFSQTVLPSRQKLLQCNKKCWKHISNHLD